MYERDGIVYAGEPEPVLSVIALRPLEHHRLWARFNDGTTVVVDMTALLDSEAFCPLQNENIFNDVTIECGAPAWLNGQIDIAPEWLLEHGERMSTGHKL
ncbi:hypothetical protein AGMMS49992_32520 [Clostridia bacterium]|nr:hypothetical protein AGMMS49992_32520 [Clostridia bacterium]